MNRPNARQPMRLAAAASLLLLALVGCGNVIDDELLETEIRNGVQSQTGVTLSDVTCPENRPVQAGDVFTCTATVDDGRSLEVTVTQNDDQGNVRWELAGESSPDESP